MAIEPLTPRQSPEASGLLADIRRQKRYQHFRPWFEDVRVVDLEPGDGFGIDYASRFAKSAAAIVASEGPGLGTPPSSPVARRPPEEARFHLLEADLVLAFGKLDRADGLSELAATLHGWNGRIVLSADFDQADPVEEPLETRAASFASRVEHAFMGRTVRYLSQSVSWPFLLDEGISPGAASWIAVVGEGELPSWPRVGVAMPTVGNVAGAVLASLTLARFYPGPLRVAIVANGTSSSGVAGLREFEEAHPGIARVIACSENLGFAGGCNLGLSELWAEGGYGLFGVCNDDVVPAFDCVCEMAEALRKLADLGFRPGMIGPVSNIVNGAQQVDIGGYGDLGAMLSLAGEHHRRKASTVTQAVQVRGLFLLLHPDLLRAIGGFDTRFGIGNFEDDDFNLRAKLAGFTSWIAEGAFLHHEGSMTFRSLGVDYAQIIQRNARLFSEKWRIGELATWPSIQAPPDGVSLYVPLASEGPRTPTALRRAGIEAAVADVVELAEREVA